MISKIYWDKVISSAQREEKQWENVLQVQIQRDSAIQYFSYQTYKNAVKIKIVKPLSAFQNSMNQRP